MELLFFQFMKLQGHIQQ